MGEPITADVSNAKYKVTKGNIDTSGIGGLPSAPTFPFDAATVHAGQRIEVESVAAMSGTSITEDKVKLQQQALVGTVSGLQGSTTAGPVTFTLTVASDVFAMLSGETQVTVYASSAILRTASAYFCRSSSRYSGIVSVVMAKCGRNISVQAVQYCPFGDNSRGASKRCTLEVVPNRPS